MRERKKKGTSSWVCDIYEEEHGGEAEQEAMREREASFV